MKNKALYLIVLLFCGLGTFSQVTTIPEEDIDPEDSLKIIVDLSKLDNSLDHTQNLLDAAAEGEDMYIWTWLPFEFPAGHPKVNGTGTEPWKSSNDNLKMTKEGDNVYSFSMIPTEFYEVDAATVYQEDIHFLVKPKDGGGYGDPDIKSEDLMVAVDPPTLERDPSYIFPEAGFDQDIFTIYYDNDRETKTSMQDLEPGQVYLFATATLSDSSTVNIVPNLFSVGLEPKLEVPSVGNGRYRKFIHPRRFFNVPDELGIITMAFVVVKKDYASSADRTDTTIEVDMGCP